MGVVQIIRQALAALFFEFASKGSRTSVRETIMATLAKRIFLVALLGALWIGSIASAHGRDIRITLPKRSHFTPVQRLNREGVEAIKKGQYDQAKALFYKAYLFDPGDPFTLNNLGYVAELEGQVDRAENFYALASTQVTEARVDTASRSTLEGESLQTAISSVRDVSMRINRGNVHAVRLLSQGRVREADDLLQQTLALDPKNPFTLNNLGVVKEAEGEYGAALTYYTAVASAHVGDPVVVTMDATWRGKPLSEMARASAARLRANMNTLQRNAARVLLLNLRGVAALNRNDRQAAWLYFSQAYKLAPDNAFSLNNQGYMAELSGDTESAQEFYREAQRASGATNRVGLATRSTAEGTPLSTVADESETAVGSVIDAATAARRREGGPIELKRRDGKPIVEPSTPPPTNPRQ
jgi:Flp pilus assembly protein TadD